MCLRKREKSKTSLAPFLQWRLLYFGRGADYAEQLCETAKRNDNVGCFEYNMLSLEAVLVRLDPFDLSDMMLPLPSTHLIRSTSNMGHVDETVHGGSIT